MRGNFQDKVGNFNRKS